MGYIRTLFTLTAFGFGVVCAGTSAPAPAPVPAPTPAPVPAPVEHTLVVKVSGIKTDKGNIRLAVHDNETSFPKKWDKALRVVTVPVPAGKTEVTIRVNLKPGTYALLAHHDEDADGQIKRYLIGMPAEGMVNSGTKPLIGAPAWDKSKFAVPEISEQTLTLRYL